MNLPTHRSAGTKLHADLPLIGARWTPQSVERRDTLLGTYESVNPRDTSTDAGLIQSALLLKTQTHKGYGVADLLFVVILFGSVGIAAFFYLAR